MFCTTSSIVFMGKCSRLIALFKSLGSKQFSVSWVFLQWPCCSPSLLALLASWSRHHSPSCGVLPWHDHGVLLVPFSEHVPQVEHLGRAWFCILQEDNLIPLMSLRTLLWYQHQLNKVSQWVLIFVTPQHLGLLWCPFLSRKIGHCVLHSCKHMWSLLSLVSWCDVQNMLVLLLNLSSSCHWLDWVFWILCVKWYCT